MVAVEEVVGRNLLKMEARERLVLATKVFYPMSDDPNDRGLSRQHILSSIDRSLKRIGTDHVDLYIVHAFDPATPIEETMQALHDVVILAVAERLIFRAATQRSPRGQLTASTAAPGLLPLLQTNWKGSAPQ